nr:hypothetical protein [Tanacetum cinerariifolium]
MDLESAQNNIVSKFPLLKQDDYKMWKLRIKQYFQVQDYTLWDIIENGNSFNPVPRITANADVSAASTPVSIVTYPNNTANLSDATVYAFLANQPNGSQLVHEDLKQIHEDDLEETYLKWQLTLLSMRARRSPRSQESRPRNHDSSRKTMIVEDTFSKDMVAIDGSGFDWSYIGDDEVPTNMALMAFSDSKVSDCDEDESREVVVKFENVQHKPEQVNQPRKENQNLRNNRTIWNQMRTQKLGGPMLLSPQHAGFGDLKLRFKIMSPKTLDHTFVRDLTMLIQKADSRNKSFLLDNQEYDGGFVAFTGSSKGGKIAGKGIENQLNHKVKIIRCDNGTKFKNYEMNQFCGIKRIKRESSNARTSQQNGVAERKNRTLIEAARTMVLVTKPHNKTPYELLIGRAPIINFMRPFGCPVTILNTLDHLGKFDGKSDEGFLVGSGPEWLFDIDSLINYQPVSAGNRTNGIACSKIHSDVGQKRKQKVSNKEYILLPVLNTSSYVPLSNEEVVSSPKDDAGNKSIVESTCVKGGNINDLGCLDQQMKSTDDSENTNSTNSFNTASPTVNTASDKDGTFQRTYGEWNFLKPIPANAVGSSFSHPATLDDFSKMPNLEDTRIFDDAYDDRDEGAEADYIT